MRKIICALVILSMFMAKISGDIPGCDYFDTVDLSNSKKLESGSYQYENILIPPEKIGEYEYQILFDGEKETVPKQIRGCACQVKSCVRFCCDPHKLITLGKRKCNDEITKYDSLLNITLHNGTVKEVDVLKEFVVQKNFGVPCADHFPFNEKDKWTLFENGILYRDFDSSNHGKKDYCLQPDIFDDHYKLVPHQCPPSENNIYVYVQMVSIFCMILTIGVHLIVLESSATNKFKISYFICLTLSFSLLRISDRFTLEMVTWCRTFCIAFGCVGYYAVMATFLWLLIINYNFFKTFKYSGSKKDLSFIKANIFVWIVAAVLLLITWLIDYNIESKLSNELWKPGFGHFNCWIDTYNWSVMLYLYGPMSILLLFNIIFSILTSWYFYKSNKEISIPYEDNKKIKNGANFLMFLRLFIVAGVIWVLEIIGFLLKENPWLDFILSAQGVTLFIATVLKKEVLRLLYDRFWRDPKTKTLSNTYNTSEFNSKELTKLNPKLHAAENRESYDQRRNLR